MTVSKNIGNSTIIWQKQNCFYLVPDDSILKFSNNINWFLFDYTFFLLNVIGHFQDDYLKNINAVCVISSQKSLHNSLRIKDTLALKPS